MAYILQLQFTCPAVGFKSAFVCLGFVNTGSQGNRTALNWYNLYLLS
jgi:hypothetical protein